MIFVKSYDMLRICILFLTFCLFLFPVSYGSEADSLLIALKSSEEAKQVEIYNDLALIYARNYSVDTAKIYTDKALSLAIKYHDLEQQGNAYYNYGAINYYSSNLAKGIDYKQKAAAIFEKSGNTKSYAICMNDIGCSYTDLGEPGKALQYLYKSYDINKENNYTHGLVENLLNLGIVYYNNLDYEKALTLYRKAIPVADSSGYSRIFFIIYNNIGALFSGWGKHDSSIVYYQEALKCAEEFTNKEQIATAYNNIGYEYMVWKKYDKAMEFFQLALALDKEIDYEISIASDYSNIGLIHYYKNEVDMAMNYFQESYKLAQKMTTPYYIALALGNMGKVLQKKGQHAEALSIILREIETIEKYNVTDLSIRAYQHLGSVYTDLRNYGNALIAFHKGLLIAKDRDQLDALKDCYKLISNTFKEEGKADSALVYYELYTLLKDSIFTSEQHRQLAEFQAKYELIKKDKEIMNILGEKQHILFQRKMLIIILVSSLLLMTTMIYFLYKGYSKNKKLMRFLSGQKKEIEGRLKQLAIDKSKQNTYAGWNLSEEATESVYQQVVYFLKESKIYLNDDLTLAKLSQKANLQAHHISRSVNVITNSNFSDLINSLRIDEAKKRMKDRDFQLFTIEAVGRSVGFKSRTSFIAAFKKFEGTTPSEYKNNWK